MVAAIAGVPRADAAHRSRGRRLPRRAGSRAMAARPPATPPILVGSRTGATTGTATWNGEEPYLGGRHLLRHRSRNLYRAGTGLRISGRSAPPPSCLDNDTGWADFPPTIDPNPFDLTVRPGRQVRVAVSIDGGDPLRVVARLGRPGQPRFRRRGRRHRHVGMHRRQRRGRPGRHRRRRPTGRGRRDDPGPPEPDLCRRRLGHLLAALRQRPGSPSSAPTWVGRPPTC